jgi:glycosyltransferase involved in cell wall biosynthesis
VHRQQPIDVLEGAEIALAFMPRRLPLPTVIRMNGGHHFFAVTLGSSPRPWRGWLERRSFMRASHLCAASQFVASTTGRLLGLEHRAIPVLPNPVDIDAFCPAPEAASDDTLVLFVGTVCEKKGIRQLVDAMPRIVEAVPQARLAVCGRDSSEGPASGSCIAHLQTRIPPHLAGRVVFHGAIPHAEIAPWIARAAVCVYPSHMEALPLAWLEALAMGKAVVASDIGPGAEVIEDGVSGLLCDPHDPDSIADRVIQVLCDRTLRARLGREARRRAVTHFSLDALIVRNETFYAEACRGFRADHGHRSLMYRSRFADIP